MFLFGFLIQDRLGGKYEKEKLFSYYWNLAVISYSLAILSMTTGVYFAGVINLASQLD